MNEMTPASTGTALAIVLPESTALATMLSQPEKVEELITRIEAEARSHAPDLTTKKGRDAIKSLAHTVARSKTALDGAGKALTDDARKKINVVDTERRKVRERLDALKAEVRKPLDEWEAAEEARVEAHQRALSNFDRGRADIGSSSEQVRSVLAEIEATTTGPEWDEYQQAAEAKKAEALEHFRRLLAAAEKRESEAAELERLRAEAAERTRRDAEEAAAKAEAERLERERVESERRAAEQAERDRIAAEEAEKAEAARREQVERDRAEAAERARVEAEERAARAAKEAEERHAKELAEAKAREERAAQAERDRLAAERKAEADARAKREADQAHRMRIRNEIARDLASLDSGNWFSVADALIEGKIPHVRVSL